MKHLKSVFISTISIFKKKLRMNKLSVVYVSSYKIYNLPKFVEY